MYRNMNKTQNRTETERPKSWLALVLVSKTLGARITSNSKDDFHKHLFVREITEIRRNITDD